MSTPPSSTDRTLAALRALVTRFLPVISYFGRYRYSVHSATATTFDGIPVDSTVAPALPVGVPYALSLAGSSCIPSAGTIAHVMFADGDPGQPVCVGFEGSGAAITVSIDAASLNFGAAAGVVLRSGDTVNVPGIGPVILTLTLGTAQSPPVPSKVKA